MDKKSYEKPRIETISAKDVVEMMGPVQGYGGQGVSGIGPDAAVAGGSGPHKLKI